MDGVLTGTSNLGQSGPGSNGNKYTHKISRTGASPSDTLILYSGHPFFAVGGYTFAGDTIGKFFALPAGLKILCFISVVLCNDSPFLQLILVYNFSLYTNVCLLFI